MPETPPSPPPAPRPGDDESIDARLADRLRETLEPGPATTAEIDAAIRAEIRAHFDAAATPRPVLRRLTPWIAAAATLGIAVTAWRFALPGRSAPHGSSEIALAGDLDGNSVVDVRDALILARRVDRGAPLESDWDLDGDGAVTTEDANAMARAIVRLPEGTGS